MPDLQDGESTEMKGSGSRPYVLKNVGGVYSCTCPAWRNQSVGIERRTCKHLRKLRGDAAEEARIGSAVPVAAKEPGTTNAPPLLLAESWDGESDPSGWWLSEKLDGVRAYWTGKEFLSRQGNLFHAPAWFRAGLPHLPLDGELWLGRKKFQRAVSIVRRQDESDLWKELTFVVFDAPQVEQAFEQRLAFVHECLQQHQSEYVRALDHIVCQSATHLQQELDRLEALGAEGVMLRQPGSHYEAGRSSTLLKVKRFLDAEARVVKHQPGTGRHKGRLGALLVEMPNGTTFAVGTGFSDAQRDNPPEIGSTITYRYQELSDGGVPRFPSFIGIRVEAETPVPTTQGVSMPKSASMSALPQLPQTLVKRRFEFNEGNSDKFWEVTIDGTDVTVCFGRIGTGGTTQTKSFADHAAAMKHAENLVKQKTAKGYRETK